MATKRSRGNAFVCQAVSARIRALCVLSIVLLREEHQERPEAILGALRPLVWIGRILVFAIGFRLALFWVRDRDAGTTVK